MPGTVHPTKIEQLYSIWLRSRGFVNEDIPAAKVLDKIRRAYEIEIPESVLAYCKITLYVDDEMITIEGDYLIQVDLTLTKSKYHTKISIRYCQPFSDVPSLPQRSIQLEEMWPNLSKYEPLDTTLERLTKMVQDYLV